MKVVVTGGAGYIGSVTVEQLVATGAEVVVVTVVTADNTIDTLVMAERE